MAQPTAFVEVTPEAFERAVRVWLKVAPRSVWEPYLKMLEVDPKRRREEDRADPRDALAAYITAKFVQAGWIARHEEPARPPG